MWTRTLWAARPDEYGATRVARSGRDHCPTERMAVGLFNRGLAPHMMTLRWSDMGLRGPQPVRDLWQRKDLGSFADSMTATVPRHGVVFVKIGKPR